uniref:Peptidase C14 caspase domain-containing protein n=1 Tax=Chromera velia CCMP2878 TaxID=1169474 RepID=A0A0G4I399_9ALVE|eukprot:Cvel_10593.t1-p1 / transcript=Cvel_10593.t1 / gene=Cvel_10593 / organism=Chromera_velia_CCMP2878 / gene_product=hypothetical protein / transcript_product=hypothetical protein / location=Cvel_scaffold642:46095-48257(-) / protein_length=349 / sequence_SO=supercontig / SO=protein_coding / is_pseudo=false
MGAHSPFLLFLFTSLGALSLADPSGPLLSFLSTERTRTGTTAKQGLYATCIGSMQNPFPKTDDPETAQVDGTDGGAWDSLLNISKDVEGVCALLHKYGFETKTAISYAQTKKMRPPESKRPKPMLTAADAIEELRQMFRKGIHQVAPVFFFYYSGHGDSGRGKPTNRGALVFQKDVSEARFEKFEPETGTAQDLLRFKDFLAVWKQEKRSLDEDAKFFVMADSCYSGKLVMLLRESWEPGLNMAIQSAGDSRQSVLERESKHGDRTFQNGEMTGWWLAKNKDRTMNAVRYRSTEDHPQFPQFWCTWEKDKDGGYVDPETKPPNFEPGPHVELQDEIPGGLVFINKYRDG